jgi:Leucine-rich repeat (LRR) protein
MSSAPRIAEIDGVPALVVLEGGWRDEYANVIREKRLAALSVRVIGGDLSFLEGLPHLRCLVLNGTDVRDISSVQALGALETLCLNVSNRKRLDLDFARFSRLRDLTVEWNPGFDSVFACGVLERLYVAAPPDPDLSRFAALTSLRRLELGNGARLTSTTHLRDLQALTFLGLYHQRALTSLVEVSELPHLAALDINTCRRLGALDSLAGAHGLKSLHVANCGDIESLAPLETLTGLETFYAWESTRVADGDLSVLLRLPRLRTVAMMSRPEYRPPLQEIEARLGTSEHHA